MFTKRNKLNLFLEFLIVGLVFGIIEDLIAIKLASGAPIDSRTIAIAFFVALPFAVFSELIVDQARIKRLIKRELQKVRGAVSHETRPTSSDIKRV